MNQFTVKQIGTMEMDGEGMFIRVLPEFIPALKNLEGFSHTDILWWFDGCDDEESRSILEVEHPYKHSPDIMGTFATRSPQRPNPIALTVAQILCLDHDAGIVRIAYADARQGSPVLDLKPYTPSLDRVEHPGVPDWCSHWPQCLEESGEFDWENEFDF